MAHYEDAMEKIGDTVMVGKEKNPKGTAEGRRNVFKQNPLAHAAHTSGLWYFILKRCLPFPEIIVELKKSWVKGKRQCVTASGVLALDFSSLAISAAFSVRPNNNPLSNLNFKSLAPSKTSNLYTAMLKWFNREAKQNLTDLPLEKIEVPDTHSVIGWLLSMVAILCGEENDKFVSLHQLSLVYYISHPYSPRHYDFARYLSDQIEEHFERLEMGESFRYMSVVIWLLIFQHHSIFTQMRLIKISPEGLALSVDSWTQEVRSSASYMEGVEKFLVPMLRFLSGGSPMQRLSDDYKNLLQQNLLETGDWYYAADSTFIRLYGFEGKPFLLPLYVTDWVFGMEFARQIDYIDATYGSRANKKMIYPIPYQVGPITIKNRGVHSIMKKKLEGLGLIETIEHWTYDPRDIFAKRVRAQSKPPVLNSQKRPEIEKYANLSESGPFIPRNIVLGNVVHNQERPGSSDEESEPEMTPTGYIKTTDTRVTYRRRNEGAPSSGEASKRQKVQSGDVSQTAQQIQFQVSMLPDPSSPSSFSTPVVMNVPPFSSSNPTQVKVSESITSAPLFPIISTVSALSVVTSTVAPLSDTTTAVMATTSTTATPTQVLSTSTITTPIPSTSTITTPVPIAFTTSTSPPHDATTLPLSPTVTTSFTTPLKQLASLSTPKASKSPVIQISGQEVSVDGIMAEYKRLQAEKSGEYTKKLLSKLPAPDDQVRLRSHHDPKKRTLRMAIAQHSSENVAATNTAIMVDLDRVPREDKTELLQTMVNMNTSEATKLEVNLEKAMKKYSHLVQQFETKKKADAATIANLKKAVQSAPSQQEMDQLKEEVSKLKIEVCTRDMEKIQIDLEKRKLQTKIDELQSQVDNASLSTDLIKKAKAKFCENLAREMSSVFEVRDYVDTALGVLTSMKSLIEQKEDDFKKLQEEASKAYKIINKMSDVVLATLQVGSRLDVLVLMNHSTIADEVIHQGKIVTETLEQEVLFLKNIFAELEGMGLLSFWRADGSSITEDDMREKLKGMAEDNEDIQKLSAQVTEEELLESFEKLTNMKNKILQMHKIKDTLSYENVNRVTLTSAKVQALMKDDGKIQAVLSKLIASQTDGTAGANA